MDYPTSKKRKFNQVDPIFKKAHNPKTKRIRLVESKVEQEPQDKDFTGATQLSEHLQVIRFEADFKRFTILGDGESIRPISVERWDEEGLELFHNIIVWHYYPRGNSLTNRRMLIPWASCVLSAGARRHQSRERPNTSPIFERSYWNKSLQDHQEEERNLITHCLKYKIAIPQFEKDRILQINLIRQGTQNGVLNYLKKRESISSPRPYSVFYQQQWEDKVVNKGEALEVNQKIGITEDEDLTRKIMDSRSPIRRMN